MHSYRRAVFASILTPVAAAFLLVSFAPAVSAQVNGDSEQVSTLLSDVKFEALELSTDADRMESFVRSHLSWQTFTTTINEIRGHINKTGKLLTKLNQVRDSASPWQQQAIDHILPPLKELAANTELTIAHLNDNQKVPHSPELDTYCRVNYVTAEKLSALIGDFIDYGKAKADFEELQKKVESH